MSWLVWFLANAPIWAVVIVVGLLALAMLGLACAFVMDDAESQPVVDAQLRREIQTERAHR